MVRRRAAPTGLEWMAIFCGRRLSDVDKYVTVPDGRAIYAAVVIRNSSDYPSCESVHAGQKACRAMKPTLSGVLRQTVNCLK